MLHSANRWRWLFWRRTSQLTLWLLFFGTAHWGWTLFEQPLLRGMLSASELLGHIPLADPFATLQILATRHPPHAELLLGALLVTLLYGVIGGRVFCSWVCPVNIVTDAAAWLRGRLKIKDAIHLSRRLRYWILGLALILSAITGVAAFEWISPVGMTHRGVIYGFGLAWIALLGIFLFDLWVLRHGWCGHLCPLGGFYALLGRIALLRVRFEKGSCSSCGDCAVVCPEPQVLNLKRARANGFIAGGECSNCGHCLPVCPEGSLSFDWRPLIQKHNQQAELHAGGSSS